DRVPSSSFETRARSFDFTGPLSTRAPQDEDGRAHAALRLVAEPLRSPISRCQTAHLVPAARFLRPGVASLLRSPEAGGGGSAENRSGPAAPVGACHDAARQAPSEAPCVP